MAARTKDECRRIEETLLRYFAEHHAGPFVLGSIDISSINDGFDRMGYEYNIMYRNQVEIAPDGLNCFRIYASLYDAVQIDARARRRIPKESLRVLKEKLSGFNSMTNIDQFLAWNIEHMFDELAEAAWNSDDVNY